MNRFLFKIGGIALVAATSISLVACKKDPPPVEEAEPVEAEVEVETNVQEPPAAVDAPPLPNSPVPTQLRAEDRFIHPQLVEAIQARSGLIPPPPPRIEGLLRRSDFRDIIQFSGDIDVAELPGKDASPTYNSTRFAMDDGFGCALQRWQYDSVQEIDALYVAFTEALMEPVGEPRVDVAAVRTEHQGLQNFAFKHLASRSMLYLSCDAKLVNVDQMRELVTRIALRL